VKGATASGGFSKPAFASWMLMVALSLVLYFNFAQALFLALTLAVICRPLYESLLGLLGGLGLLRRHPGIAMALASLTTQALACLLLLVCVLIPFGVLVQNRLVIFNSALSASAGAREWSRGKIQALGERLHIQEWTDFEELPAPGEAQAPSPTGSFREQPMQEKVVDMLSHPAPFLRSALTTVGGWALWLGQLMFFFMAMHFMLLHGRHFWAGVLEAIPGAWRPTLAFLSQRARTVMVATCMVHGLTALSAFFLALPVFWVLVGAKHFMLLAMLAGFFQFIPLLGSATLLGMVTLYFFATGATLQGWESLLLGFPVIVGVPDLLVRPYLSERYGRVHSMTMLAGFITGIEIFGPLGFVLGPLVLDLIVQFSRQILLGRVGPGGPRQLKPEA
jgi:predicted PurR-regulated permease PerM